MKIDHWRGTGVARATRPPRASATTHRAREQAASTRAGFDASAAWHTFQSFDLGLGSGSSSWSRGGIKPTRRSALKMGKGLCQGVEARSQLRQEIPTLQAACRHARRVVARDEEHAKTLHAPPSQHAPQVPSRRGRARPRGPSGGAHAPAGTATAARPATRRTPPSPPGHPASRTPSEPWQRPAGRRPCPGGASWRPRGTQP